LYQKEIGVNISVNGGNTRASGIVVPFLLTLEEKCHSDFISTSPDPRYRSENATVGFQNLQEVQSYLIDHSNNPGVIPFTQISINLHSFHETLDLLHDIVLKRIEEIYHNAASC
jgi:hypothetical protein